MQHADIRRDVRALFSGFIFFTIIAKIFFIAAGDCSNPSSAESDASIMSCSSSCEQWHMVNENKQRKK